METMGKGWTFFLALMLILPAYGAETKGKAHASVPEIVKAIKVGRVLTPGYPIDVKINGSGVDVSTYRNPEANDDDCKIDAVLVAKQVVGADSKVERVRVIFHSSPNSNNYVQTTVTAGDIQAFGSGKMSQKTLLAALELKQGMRLNPLAQYQRLNYQEILQMDEGAPGELRHERETCFAQIRTLKDKGLALELVNNDLEDYLRIEDLCRHGHGEKAKQRLTGLNAALAEQSAKLGGLPEPQANQAAAETAGKAQEAASALQPNPAPVASEALSAVDWSQAHKELGSDTPHPGPSPRRRLRLIRRIRELACQGKDMNEARGAYREIEDLAFPETQAQMNRLLNYWERQLGIVPEHVTGGERK